MLELGYSGMWVLRALVAIAQLAVPFKFSHSFVQTIKNRIHFLLNNRLVSNDTTSHYKRHFKGEGQQGGGGVLIYSQPMLSNYAQWKVFFLYIIYESSRSQYISIVRHGVDMIMPNKTAKEVFENKVEITPNILTICVHCAALSGSRDFTNM